MSNYQGPNPAKLYWVSPQHITYCTPNSPYTDINQHEANKEHPHAFHNRGYFKEIIRKGVVLAGTWDRPDLKFTELLEYKALRDHILGIRPWCDSQFAKRCIHYISLGYTSRGHSDTTRFLVERQANIDNLIDSIKRFGVRPSKGVNPKHNEWDNISVNVARDGELLFNNRGHHRLAIAKILGIEKLPVQVVVWHKLYFDRYGFMMVDSGKWK
jgi:hypothetical protein